MAEHSDLDQIWMVVTPHNSKEKNTLLMITTACNGASCH
jgi:hypothetical protein